MKDKSFGTELIDAVKEAIDSKSSGTIVRRAKINTISLRKKLHLTQKEFAKRYHIKLETLRSWEQGKRTPDTTSLAYLACIAKRPNLIKNILVDVFD